MNVRRIATIAGAVTFSTALVGCTAAPEPESGSAVPDPGTSSDQQRSAPSADADADADAGAGGYQDGQFTARGWYGSAPSHHDVTLTIEEGTITAVAITTPAENETSLGYQQRFAEALPQAVTGRNIDELDIERLAGSSGCSEGFMAALDQIKQQASRGVTP